jgi:hypothetical protein
MRCLQHPEEQSPEQTGEHPDRQEEAWPASDPAFAILRQPAARHDDVDMRVMGHGRAPCVQHACHADLGTEVL